VNVTGDILIEETGRVEADISGTNIVIKGTVNGNVSAEHRIEIYATGVMIGDISARSVDIQEGATFEGRSHMMRPNSREHKPPDASSDNEENRQNIKAEKSDS
jgi:cytoskeletal protein CcmA (bactofilin family)